MKTDIDPELVEKLAAAEHAGWASWMKYLFEKCQANPDGSLTIPADLVRHWEGQIRTSYGNLSEPEKEADRKEVRKILPLIQETVGSNDVRSRTDPT